MALRRAARRVAPAAVAFLLAVVLFAPATLGGKVLSASDMPLFQAPFRTQPAGARPENPLQFDSAYVFEPDGLQVREALRDARLPVWSSKLAAGLPLLASQQSAPLYPLTWLGAVFPYWESLAWIAVLKLTLAALGTFLLARALGLGLGPAALGAIAFGFGTYLVVWLMHPHANAYVVLPWLFLLAERLCRSARLQGRRVARRGAGRRLPERPARERAHRLAGDGGVGDTPAGLDPPGAERGAAHLGTRRRRRRARRRPGGGDDRPVHRGAARVSPHLALGTAAARGTPPSRPSSPSTGGGRTARR